MFSKKLHDVEWDDRTNKMTYSRRGHGNFEETYDMSHIRILHAGWDTTESYYSGNLKVAKVEHLLGAFNRAKDRGDFDPVISFEGYNWIMRPGGKSGYRYSLQSKRLGLQIFFVNSKAEEENTCVSHVKIVSSPHFLNGRTDKECVEDWYDRFATRFLENAERCGFGAHICADVLNAPLEGDYLPRLVVHPKFDHAARSIDTLVLDTARVSMTYGKMETVTLGNRQYQFQIYDKGQQAFQTNRTHYWSSRWAAGHRSRYGEDWDGEGRVTRFELRIAHGVMREMERGSSVDLSDQIEAGKVIKSIWLAGLNNFRLDANSQYVDPLWQYLAEEIRDFDQSDVVEIVRHYAQSAGMPYERCLKLAVAYCLKTWVAHGASYERVREHMIDTGLMSSLVEVMSRDGQNAHQELYDRYERLRLDGHDMAKASEWREGLFDA